MGNIQIVRTAGDLGELGATVGTSTGALTIAGVVRSAINIDHDIAGPITIGGWLGRDISCDSMEDLIVVGKSELFTPSITIRGPYAHAIDIPGIENIDVWGEMSGTIDVQWNLGILNVGYDPNDPNGLSPLSGAVSVGQDAWEVNVRGDLTGTLDVAEHLEYANITRDVSGSITVDGSAGDWYQMTGGLEIGRDVTATGELTVGLDLAVAHISGDLNGSLNVLTGDILMFAVDGALAGEANVVEGYLHTAELGSHLSGTLSVYLMLQELNLGGQCSGTLSVEGDLYSAYITGNVSGTIAVGRDAIYIEAPNIVAGGLVDVGRDLYALRVIALPGDVHVHGNLYQLLSTVFGSVTGTVTVDGDMIGRITAWADVSADAEITVGGNVQPGGGVSAAGDISGDVIISGQFAGLIRSGGNLAGQVRIVGDVLSTGQMLVGTIPENNGRLTGAVEIGTTETSADLLGSIIVYYDQTGSISVHGDVVDENADLGGGHIIVNGSLIEGAQISIDGGFASTTEFIAVDHDGWSDGDDWGSNDPNDANNPYVRMHAGDPNDDYYYYGNTPTEHVWHITECRGDMNNDGIVSYADINGFTLALSQPGLYALRYPGLGGVAPDPNTGGSRVYHGDMNCDGLLTYADINPFVIRLEEGCCDPNCGACGGNLLQGGGQRLSPQALATRLMLNIDPDLYDDLVEIVAQAATGLDDAGDRAYWQAVYGYLAE